jgi:hypothetical protein
MGPPAALQWLGEPNPIASISESKARDPKRQQLSTIVQTWDDAAKEVDGLKRPASDPRTVTELIELADAYIDRDNGGAKSFKDALEAIGTDKEGRLSKKRIGWYLKQHMDMAVGGKMIRQEPSTRSTHWYLESGSR